MDGKRDKCNRSVKEYDERCTRGGRRQREGLRGWQTVRFRGLFSLPLSCIERKHFLVRAEGMHISLLCSSVLVLVFLFLPSFEANRGWD